MQEAGGSRGEFEKLRADLARDFAAIAMSAGMEILAVRAAPRIRLKSDQSPVTDADERAEKVILQRLAAICPGLPVVSEEAAAAGAAPQTGRAFLLVDPLDGTREFVAGREEFTVNLALVVAGEAVAGVVYAPAMGVMWCGATEADGARAAWTCAVASPGECPACGPESPLRTRSYVRGQGRALVSYSHRDRFSAAFLGRCGIDDIRAVGSSLKFGLIAAGQADVYPRFSPTREWDIAAGDAVLRAAGGLVIQPDGNPVRYGNPGFHSPDFIALGDPAAARAFVAAAGRSGISPPSTCR